MNELWLKSPKQALIVATNLPKHSSSNGTWMLLVFSVLLVVSSIYYFRKKKTQKVVLDYNLLELRLINANKILNTDEMDEIFEITHLELDARKLKRSRMIEEINSRFPNFIIREKDNTDKRKFVYRIHQ